MNRKKVLTAIFVILTVCGAIYVFYTRGKANAGYAVVPLIFCLLIQRKKDK